MGINFSGKFGSSTVIWYPASGFLKDGQGALYEIGNYSFVWSASPDDWSEGAYSLTFYYDTKPNMSSGYPHAMGFAVRCIQESK